MSELTSGEIRLMFKRIDEKLDDHSMVHDDIMKAIKDLSDKIDEQRVWTGYAKGAIAVFILLVLPVVIWTVSQVVNIDRKIAEALDGYEINITN